MTKNRYEMNEQIINCNVTSVLQQPFALKWTYVHVLLISAYYEALYPYLLCVFPLLENLSEDFLPTGFNNVISACSKQFILSTYFVFS